MDTGGTELARPRQAVDPARHRALASASRVRILQMLREAETGLPASALVRATGMHSSTVRAHLDHLVEAGLVSRRRQADGSPGRPAWRYQAAAAPDSVAGPYRDLAAALAGHLARTEDDPHEAGVQAGRDWGRALAARVGAGTGRPVVDGLVQVLDRLGFAPRVVRDDEHGPTILHLYACPFLDLVATNADVVCGLHLGVIGGALGAMGAPASTATLTPFGAPHACVVALRADRRTNGDAR